MSKNARNNFAGLQDLETAIATANLLKFTRPITEINKKGELAEMILENQDATVEMARSQGLTISEAALGSPEQLLQELEDGKSRLMENETARKKAEQVAAEAEAIARERHADAERERKAEAERQRVKACYVARDRIRAEVQAKVKDLKGLGYRSSKIHLVLWRKGFGDKPDVNPLEGNHFFYFLDVNDWIGISWFRIQRQLTNVGEGFYFVVDGIVGEGDDELQSLVGLKLFKEDLSFYGHSKEFRKKPGERELVTAWVETLMRAIREKSQRAKAKNAADEAAEKWRESVLAAPVAEAPTKRV